MVRRPIMTLGLLALSGCAGDLGGSHAQASYGYGNGGGLVETGPAYYPGPVYTPGYHAPPPAYYGRPGWEDHGRYRGWDYSHRDRFPGAQDGATLNNQRIYTERLSAEQNRYNQRITAAQQQYNQQITGQPQAAPIFRQQLQQQSELARQQLEASDRQLKRRFLGQ